MYKIEPYVTATCTDQQVFSKPINKITSVEMALAIADIAKLEGPIHIEELYRRINGYCGGKRARSKVRKAVNRGLEEAQKQKMVQCHDDGFVLGETDRKVIRKRTNVRSRPLRKAGMLPSSEIKFAIANAVEEGPKEHRVLVNATAKIFGMKYAKNELNDRISPEIQELLRINVLENSNGQYSLKSEQHSSVCCEKKSSDSMTLINTTFPPTFPSVSMGTGFNQSVLVLP